MPKRNTPTGFTLIELLVVIAIIAILATIALVIYSGVQRNGRDAKRRSEIDAIAQALESHYMNASGNLCDGTSGTNSNGGYYCPLQANWFGNSTIPADTDTAATPYCIFYNATGSTLGVVAVWSGGSCPAAGLVTNASAMSPIPPASGVVPAVNTATMWKVCAVLETNTTTPYCQTNKQ